jgi:hypothetical protein
MKYEIAMAVYNEYWTQLESDYSRGVKFIPFRVWLETKIKENKNESQSVRPAESCEMFEGTNTL